MNTSKKSGFYRSAVEETEKFLIEKTLEKTFGNQLKAAKLLDINRNTLRNKIKKFDIEVSRWKL
jgi:two-component system nitrogen regulation response regulator GlnG